MTTPEPAPQVPEPGTVEPGTSDPGTTGLSGTEPNTTGLGTTQPRTVELRASGLRASDSERERVVALLRDAVGEGRLTLTEADERITAAYAAVHRGELVPLTADLPEPGPPTAGPPGTWWPGRVPADGVPRGAAQDDPARHDAAPDRPDPYSPGAHGTTWDGEVAPYGGTGHGPDHRRRGRLDRSSRRRPPLPAVLGVLLVVAWIASPLPFPWPVLVVAFLVLRHRARHRPT